MPSGMPAQREVWKRLQPSGPQDLPHAAKAYCPYAIVGIAEAMP